MLELGSSGGAAREESAATPEIDDHARAVDDDAPDVTDGRGSEEVGGHDLEPVVGLGPHPVRLEQVEVGSAGFEHGAQRLVEQRLGRDEVDHRFGIASVRVGGGGPAEDRGERVGASLGVGAGEHAGVRVVTVLGAQLVPLGGELGRRRSD